MFDTLVDTLEHDGYTIQLYQDKKESPRIATNMCTLVCFCNGLGDSKTVQEYADVYVDNPMELLDFLESSHVALALPLSYNKGTLEMRAVWDVAPDTQLVGYAVATRSHLRNFMGWNKLTKKRLALLEKEIRLEVWEYSAWLQCTPAWYTYSFHILTPSGHRVDQDDDYDTCAHAIQAAKEYIRALQS